ncbi:spindlin interactor and repressor of chromatin-binding protein isoform X1 [Sceloporus undulatus]|uniref:spindlin interactor and repressor of chromatin-binding protein isoform X1 n=1 Tax=Sceloporus undulatus TaxID=8520 RepID=UPI001C4D23FF|nr:spindlin interactor and repressor of chromatin-binding protein isoform X1 [Sceloporus undulatus]XP_042296391.1 spindlin interactor and repressor of chromatin-binding protein isoform X1 [Sceloporus undulatus]
MALKAETPLLDYIEVSSSVLRYKEKEKADAGAVVPDCTRVKRDGASSNATGKGEQLVPSVVPGSGQEEAGSSWRQEYLIAESHGRPVCMVCGSVLSSSGPAAARKHILQQHAHSLDFNLEEKHNILEAWSEGAVLPTVEPQPSLEGSFGGSKQQAEIEVLLDSEEQPSGRKRGHLKARCELLHLDPERRAQGRPRRHNSDSAKDVRSKQSSKVAGKEWLSECGVPGSAPAEIRIFTDGTFPAGFTLKLYCRTQPEPPQDSGVKTDTRKKKTVDRNCSVSLLRLHSTDSPHHLCSSQGATSRPLTSSAGSNAKDCGTRAGQREASAGKEDAALLAKGFNPIWRARFLMDFDTAAGHLVCMVCEYPLRRVCLATVKRHILQCHAETLNLPREVRRTIREVWESRNQSSPPAPKK